MKISFPSQLTQFYLCCGECCVPRVVRSPCTRMSQPNLGAAAGIHPWLYSSQTGKLQPPPGCACRAAASRERCSELAGCSLCSSPSRSFQAWRVPWLSQADPWPDREEPESISQTFYCQVCFTHTPDKVSELALAWIFLAVACKTSESSDLNYLLLTLETLCFLDSRKKNTVPYKMENKYLIDLKEQQSYRSKPYLVQDTFCMAYPVCVNILSEFS